MAASRRLLLTVALSCVALFILLARPASFSLPTSFSLSRHADESKNMADGRRMRVQEIHGLLHLVAQSDGHLPEIDGSKELDLQVYADAAGGEDDWQSYTKRLYSETPVIVFSKTFCPYSKKAKALLKSYSLSPAPKIIELDERPDAATIKQILTRLTDRGTVPNVLLNGDSIGGSDDIQALHEEGKLRALFEEHDVKVMGNV